MVVLPKINNLAKFKPEITLINKFKNKSDININSNNSKNIKYKKKWWKRAKNIENKNVTKKYFY